MRAKRVVSSNASMNPGCSKTRRRVLRSGLTVFTVRGPFFSSCCPSGPGSFRSEAGGLLERLDEPRLLEDPAQGLALGLDRLHGEGALLLLLLPFWTGLLPI